MSKTKTLDGMIAEGRLDSDVVALLIGRAILAERSRCAKIADAQAQSQPDDYLEPEATTGRNVAARFIAAAIRSGTPQ